VSYEDRKPVAAALKEIYRALDAEAGAAALDAKAQFAVIFGERFTRAMA
jgi:hypothetical protein